MLQYMERFIYKEKTLPKLTLISKYTRTWF